MRFGQTVQRRSVNSDFASGREAFDRVANSIWSSGQMGECSSATISELIVGSYQSSFATEGNLIVELDPGTSATRMPPRSSRSTGFR